MIDAVEDRKHCGIPLDKQRRRYRETLKPWVESRAGEYDDSAGANPNYLLEILGEDLKRIAAANTVSDLVSAFRIYNLNDFKVLEAWRDPNYPSQDQFRSLLADWCRWERRSFPFIKDRRVEVAKAHLETLRAAKKRYVELAQ
jgi:hypothetical protein